MDIIKIRAWDKKYREMILPKKSMFCKGSILLPDYKRHNNTENLAVMLYSNLFDIDKKEFCKGDIFECYDLMHNERIKVTFSVGFENGAFVVTNYMPIRTLAEILCTYTDAKIIGNIYEDRNLLPCQNLKIDKCRITDKEACNYCDDYKPSNL